MGEYFTHSIVQQPLSSSNISCSVYPHLFFFFFFFFFSPVFLPQNKKRSRCLNDGICINGSDSPIGV